MGVANHINADDKYLPDVVKSPDFGLEGLDLLIDSVLRMVTYIRWSSLSEN